MPWVSRPPDPETQLRVDEFNVFRGGYLSSFAQMEFTVGRLLSRLNVTQPFAGLLDDVKFRFEARVDSFENILKEQQAISSFREQGVSLCSRLRDTYDLRNFLAHGIVRYDVSEEIFTIRRIKPAPEDPWNELEFQFGAEQIFLETSRMSLLCQEFMYFARELNDHFGLNF